MCLDCSPALTRRLTSLFGRNVFPVAQEDTVGADTNTGRTPVSLGRSGPVWLTAAPAGDAGHRLPLGPLHHETHGETACVTARFPKDANT